MSVTTSTSLPIVDFALAMREAAPYICRAWRAASLSPLKSSSILMPSFPIAFSIADFRMSPSASAIGLSAISTTLSTIAPTILFTTSIIPDPPPGMNDGSFMPATASLTHCGMPSVIAFKAESMIFLSPSESVLPGEAP